MKKIYKTLLVACVAIASTFAFAKDYIVITFADGTMKKIEVSSEDKIDLETGSFTLQGKTYQFTDITGVSFAYEEEVTPEPSDDANTIYVTWNGNEAPSIKCSAAGVTANVSGQDVTLTNENTENEYTYVLDGQSDQGSFTLVSDYKSTVELRGLTLHSTLEEALNLKCGKRVSLVVADNTVNTLSDATTDNGQKGAIYCKGHLEVSGAGKLNLEGKVKHAISTKEYLQLKKSFTGSIHISGAASDGIHAGQYFQMNNGEVTINGVKADGIQAEVTSKTDDENNGQIIIKGGQLNITTTAGDVAALKCDSLMAITGGALTLTTKGSADKALKSDTDIEISGGEFTITQSGSYIVENMDPSYTTAIKADNITITGGNISITNTAEAGKGISAEKSLVINEKSATVVLDVKANGAGGQLDTTKNIETEVPDTPDEEEVVLSYKVYVNVPTSTNNGGPGGGGGGWGGWGGNTSNAWSSVYLCNSNGTQLATLTSKVTVNGTEFYCYDFKEATTGTYYFTAPTYNSAGKNYAIRSAQFTLDNSDGKDRFYQITNSYSTSGSTRTYPINNVTSSYEGGTIGGSTSVTGSVVSAACLKSDGTIEIDGGTITLTSTGQASKGITADEDVCVNGGTLTITNSGAGLTSSNNNYTAKGITCDKTVHLVGGNINIKVSGSAGKGVNANTDICVGNESDKTGPVLNVVTTGARISGGGGSSAKAMKCDGYYYQYGGDIYIETNSDGAEGIESKKKATGSMNFNGGNLFIKAYDDCINSAGQICFTGANVIVYATENDAIDCNYGQSQSIKITAGYVICFTQRGSPEMGIDADAINRVYLSGGTLISGGGNQGGSSGTSIGSGSTHNKAWSANISYKANYYYSIVCGGKNIVTWKMPCAVSSTTNIYASDQFTSSTTHTIYEGSVAPTSGTTHLFHSSPTNEATPMIWEKSNITTGTSKGTFSPS